MPRPFAGLINAGFEERNTSGWILNDIATPDLAIRAFGPGYRHSPLFFETAPTEGAYVLVHGFDGAGPGRIRVAQDVIVPEVNPLFTFNYRAAWDLREASLDRPVNVVVEPAGGGHPLDSFTVFRALAGSYVADTGSQSKVIDLSPFAGKAVRVSIDTEVPEPNRGPGLFQLDNVALSGGGAPIIDAQSRNAAVVESQSWVLHVAARGAPPMVYQWYRDGEPITTATNMDLTLSGSSSTPTVYSATVSNALGVASSAPIRVEVVREMELAAPYADNGAIWLPVGVLPRRAYVLESSPDLVTWSEAGPPLLIGDAWSALVLPDKPRQFFRFRLGGKPKP